MSDKSPNLQSRLRGSLYGLAVGDALGAPYEFNARGSYEVTGNMEDSCTFTKDGNPLKAGTWTDDTRYVQLKYPLTSASFAENLI